MKVNMDNLKMLEGYRRRMNLLSSTYFLSEFVVNRRDGKEFDNHEFYNLIIQILCFIMDRSLKGENCTREDIVNFMDDINRVCYKKTLTRERIGELVYYILRKGLRNEGYAYSFSYYDYDNEKDSHINVQLINDEIIDIDGETKTTYFLTEDGYKLLFSTKEYDDIYEIEITKMIAEFKIKNGDYKSAREDIDKLVNLLEIQCQNIDNYIQRTKRNIAFIQNEKYSEVIGKTFDVLLSQMSKYSELKTMVLGKLDILYTEDVSSERILEQIGDIKMVLSGLDKAIFFIRKLHERKDSFSSQFKELLKSAMFINYNGRFDFEKEIMQKIEKDASFIGNLDRIYKPLFKLQSPNIFSLHVPYDEQNLQGEKVSKEIEVMSEEVELEDEKEEIMRAYNAFYEDFLRSLLDYGFRCESFYLSSFIADLKKDKNIYVEKTRYGGLVRNMLLFFAHEGEEINLEEVRKELRKVAVVNPSESFDILYSVSTLSKYYRKLPTIKISVLDETFTFLTSINLEERTATKLTVPDMEFTFIQQGGL
ncbi:hypothetical protein HMPREF1982_00022 [Clostridiales bacterium oral taxon 876 str. F0540]|nr:hypothetical protein HMPREF1982_00022 [Clostridiales bacterium oral taxon 876 str. F0540]